MNGFEKELRERILGVTAHATLMGESETLPDWRDAQTRARVLAGVVAAVPYIEAAAMVTTRERVTGVQMRGIDPAQEVTATDMEEHMLDGASLHDLVSGEYRIILGEALAASLHLKVQDKLIVVVPKGTVTPVGIVPNTRRFTVVGIFRSGMYEYDSLMVLMHAQDAARLLQLGDAMTGLRLKLDDPLQAPETVLGLAQDLAKATGQIYNITPWTRIHANFFRSIQLTKSMLFVILSMIVGIAAFNIVATLVMVVKDKEADIAILRTLGAGPRNILRTFIVQGVAIGLVGVAAGIALGALLSTYLEQIVHFLEWISRTKFMDAKVYFMSDLPAQVQLGDVAQVAVIALVLCLLATIYPAWRASRLLPAEALRHD
jgi:lipoprotein-releasing system permease protein